MQVSELFKTKAKQVSFRTLCVQRLLSGDAQLVVFPMASRGRGQLSVLVHTCNLALSLRQEDLQF